MEDFNKALLAKQGWRILKNTTSLLARVFKSRYFRNYDFVHAQCYPSLSYASKSIVQTQDLMKRGMKWIVGDGEHIDVWRDNWLHTQPPYLAQGRGTETHPHIRVKDLFHPDTKEWNVQLINDLVRQEDAKYILNIRPPISKRPDGLVWNYTKTWEYNVKTGYYM